MCWALGFPGHINLSLRRPQPGIAPYLLVLDPLQGDPVRRTQRKVCWRRYESRIRFEWGTGAVAVDTNDIMRVGSFKLFVRLGAKRVLWAQPILVKGAIKAVLGVVGEAHQITSGRELDTGGKEGIDEGHNA